MSLKARKELLLRIKNRYTQSNWTTKGQILHEFIATTGYSRKYAIHLVNQNEIEVAPQNNEKRINKRKYDETVKQPLIALWRAANQICSKRLVPFMPDLLAVLERFGHLSLSVHVRNLLLEISPATVDRLLKTERKEKKKGASTTRPGSLLKRQIKIRTFADWNDIVPGFLEGDLVAHCGDRTEGTFLNTLVLTDIASTWTEFFPLLCKNEANVITALEAAQQLLPFSVVGLDTDNGSEFINHALLKFCEIQKITFTRSRAYKKNDQAHVEEKNGSIIRRLIGHDRYEGLNAYNALSELYAVLRLYVNFFQPSLKLLSRKREDAKVTKKYDKAKTPYQRLMAPEHTSIETKEKLIKQYNNLDPVKLLKDLERLQDNFWKHAWKTDAENSVTSITINATGVSSEAKKHCVENTIITTDNEPQIPIKRYRHTNTPRNKLGPKPWCIKKDPFENIWNKVKLQLELNPQWTTKALFNKLIKENPKQFKPNQLRTFQRRASAWRKQQIQINQEKNYQPTLYARK